ncbi:MAG TPA: type II toxin-antitoxin system VapC family toxin [Rhodoglobus sp.]|nr:type II toxin-antitoxin system VapC family toxin [Rhodoglobus sp.]
MTRYGIDATVALRLLRERTAVPSQHQLVAPNLLRSEVLSMLYREVRTGDLAQADGRALLEDLAGIRIRLLGDRVSRAVAWRIAHDLDWPDVGPAEYVAVAKLQADAFVTLDAELASRVGSVVQLAPFEALLEE